jgi:hypothetical protein
MLNGAQRGAPRELFERIVAIDAVPEGWRDAARRALDRTV